MSFVRSLDRGQGLLEYALVIALVALVVILVLVLLGPPVGNMYSGVVHGI
jgi:pilus assembly protein Flp/PilA